MNPMSALYHIAQNDPPRLSNPDKWSKDFVDFVDCCLKKEPSERLSAESLKQVFYF